MMVRRLSISSGNYGCWLRRAITNGVIVMTIRQTVTNYNSRVNRMSSVTSGVIGLN